MPYSGFCGQRQHNEIISADDDGEFVGERDASAGSDEGLNLNWLIAMTGQESRRVEPVPGQEALDEIGGAAVMCEDPRVVGEVGGSDRWSLRERVTGRQHDANGVVEERLDTDSLRDRRWGEVVVEDDG